MRKRTSAIIVESLAMDVIAQQIAEKDMNQIIKLDMEFMLWLIALNLSYIGYVLTKILNEFKNK
jgi:hypothetical protein